MRGRRGAGIRGGNAVTLLLLGHDLQGLWTPDVRWNSGGAVTLLTMQPDQYSLSSAAIEGRREVVY